MTDSYWVANAQLYTLISTKSPAAACKQHCFMESYRTTTTLQAILPISHLDPRVVSAVQHYLNMPQKTLFELS